MLISGIATSTMFAAVLAPDWMLSTMFGESPNGPLSNIVVRNWGLLVGLVGLLLIYGAFDPAIRKAAILFAIVSKTSFILLVLLFGSQYLSTVFASLVFDFLVVFILAMHLASNAGKKQVD